MSDRKKYYSPSKDRVATFSERQIKSMWFQSRDWQPFNPETPESLKPMEEQDVKILNEDQGTEQIIQKAEVTTPKAEAVEIKEEPIEETVKNEMAQESVEETKLEDLDYNILAQKFEEKFGKKPHHKLKIESIISKLKS